MQAPADATLNQIAMKFTKENGDELQRFVSETLRHRECPACGSHGGPNAPVNWGLEDGFFGLVRFGDGECVPKFEMPLVKVSCTQCGYVMLFNPPQAGITMPKCS